MTLAAAAKPKAVKGVGMEGLIATWYAKNTGRSLAEFRALAKRLEKELRPGDRVLEVAPGPGYLAIELARSGQFKVTALDISHTFVRIASENARREGVAVDVRQGNASDLPFESECFDFIVTRAAFKNFGDPVGAIREMHRVLRAGGVALIVDMRKEASHEAIADEVRKMNLGLVSSFVTRATLEGLRKRAYSRDDLVRMVAQTPFGDAVIDEGGIGFEMWMTKSVN